MHSVLLWVPRPNIGKGLKNLDSVDDGRTNLRCSFDAFFVFPIVTDNLRQICHR